MYPCGVINSVLVLTTDSYRFWAAHLNMRTTIQSHIRFAKKCKFSKSSSMYTEVCPIFSRSTIVFVCVAREGCGFMGTHISLFIFLIGDWVGEGLGEWLCWIPLRIILGIIFFNIKDMVIFKIFWGKTDVCSFFNYLFIIIL